MQFRETKRDDEVRYPTVKRKSQRTVWVLDLLSWLRGCTLWKHSLSYVHASDKCEFMLFAVCTLYFRKRKTNLKEER